MVNASVSTDRVSSAASSTFRRTTTPARGEYTRTRIFVSAAVNGIIPTDSFGPVDTVVPAHNSAVADFTTFATVFVPSVGSVASVESSAPPNPVSV